MTVAPDSASSRRYWNIFESTAGAVGSSQSLSSQFVGDLGWSTVVQSSGCSTGATTSEVETTGSGENSETPEDPSTSPLTTSFQATVTSPPSVTALPTSSSLPVETSSPDETSSSEVNCCCVDAVCFVLTHFYFNVAVLKKHDE